jgi:hypothetical protein
MATRTLALTILAQEYANQIVSQINRTAVALRVLPMVVGGGSNVAWVAQGTGATAAAMADGASAGTPSNDVQKSAVLQWAYYKSDGGATGPAQAAASSASSPLGNASLLANDVVVSMAALASQVNAHAYSGDGGASPKQVTGLDQAIGDTTNTYATIVRGSDTWFQPSVFNPGVSTPVTHAQLRKDISTIKVRCGESPDLALCHPDVFTSIANTFDATRRYTQTTQFNVDRRGLITLDGSVDAVTIGGCTFVEDKDATVEAGGASGRIYYVNTRYVEWVVQPQPEIAGLLRSMGVVPGMVLRANDGFGEIPLLAAVVAMAKTGDADTYMAKTYLELRVRKPSACGVRRFVQID